MVMMMLRSASVTRWRDAVLCPPDPTFIDGTFYSRIHYCYYFSKDEIQSSFILLSSSSKRWEAAVVPHRVHDNQ